jgi:hypothetical protein
VSGASFVSSEGAERLLLSRPPVTKDELWYITLALTGVAIPRVAVCEGHQSPFDAFADAYFGNEQNWALWYGSRGTGKSYLLALLGLVKSALLEVDITLLGGSMAQSNNVHEHITKLLAVSPSISHMLRQDPTKTEITFSPGNWIRPLPASQKTVRGPHPNTTLLDEIDEMEKAIYDAAMGQALEQPNKRGEVLQEMVVASSTWQNPTGTFQEVFDEAVDQGKQIFTWCWREVCKPHGWMNPEFIERKRASVPAEMFRVEYELGRPSGEALAIDQTKIAAFFVPMTPIHERHVGNDDLWVYEEPLTSGIYAAGADWAKMRDKTVIHVTRLDVTPRRTVYLRRMNRMAWPDMIGIFNEVVNRYNAVSAHDATGLGNVVHDLVDERTLKVEFVQTKRTKLLTEYITDFERGVYRMPKGTPLHRAHEAVTVDDVFGSATVMKSHLPDDIAASAVMHRAAQRMVHSGAPLAVRKTPDLPKALHPLATEAQRVGEVYRETRTGVLVPMLSERDYDEPAAEVESGAFQF